MQKRHKERKHNPMEYLELKEDLYRILDLEQTALELQALLKVLSCAEGDCKHISELPTIIGVAAEMADKIYCAIADTVGRVK